jgi:predicted RNA-binding protein YlqC (UPF0109 family)
MARTKKASQEDIEDLSELLSIMVENVVNSPDSVVVRVDRGLASLDFEFDVDPDDVSFAIGAQHQTISALERIMYAAGRTRGLSVSLAYRGKNRTGKVPDRGDN